MDKKFIVTFLNESGKEYQVLLDNQVQVLGALTASIRHGFVLVSVIPLSPSILEDIKDSLL